MIFIEEEYKSHDSKDGKIIITIENDPDYVILFGVITHFF